MSDKILTVKPCQQIVNNTIISLALRQRCGFTFMRQDFPDHKLELSSRRKRPSEIRIPLQQAVWEQQGPSEQGSANVSTEERFGDLPDSNVKASREVRLMRHASVFLDPAGESLSLSGGERLVWHVGDRRKWQPH